MQRNVNFKVANVHIIFLIHSLYFMIKHIILFLTLHQLLCRQLGHTDLTMSGRLDNFDGKYTSNGPIWFYLLNCIVSSYGYDHNKIYECLHEPWGKPYLCLRDDITAARCVNMDQTDDYYPGKQESLICPSRPDR